MALKLYRFSFSIQRSLNCLFCFFSPTHVHMTQMRFSNRSEMCEKTCDTCQQDFLLWSEHCASKESFKNFERSANHKQIILNFTETFLLSVCLMQFLVDQQSVGNSRRLFEVISIANRDDNCLLCVFCQIVFQFGKLWSC